MNKQLLVNVNYYDGERVQKNKSILIQNGVIQKITSDILEESDVSLIDCKNKVIYPGFVDTHLHFPGKKLFELFGIDLLEETTLDGYVKKICEFKNKKNGNVIGYGWDMMLLYESGNQGKELRSALDENFPTQYAAIFSNDYHCVICNRILENKLRKDGVCSIEPNGMIRGKALFQLLQTQNELCFTKEEIREAILAYQDDLLSCGIVAAQTLMFLGGNQKQEYQVLNELDCEHKIKVQIKTACTVYPWETCDEMMDKMKQQQKYDSPHIHCNTVKLYMDGVIDQKTAFLSNPYEGDSEGGSCYWERKALWDMCEAAQRFSLQIHIHAIGDAAVHEAVLAIKHAMECYPDMGNIRHVITHLQLTHQEDIEMMSQYDIIACVQPYWIPVNANYYTIDVKNLGTRINEEYKMFSFQEKGVLMTGSSDSPVTARPYAIDAMNCALLHTNRKERLSVAQLLAMFTKNGFKQLGLDERYGTIKEGYKAALIMMNEEITEQTIQKGILKCLVLE